ncbi:MAG: AAA family ATPase, partial [Planctomycetota bacterium]
MTPRSHDILDALRDEARRLYVSIPLPPPGEDIPFPKLQELAQAFDRFLSAHELTGKTVARRLGKGFSEATISNFRRLAKVGDPAELPGHQFEKIARKIAAWMEEYHEQKSAVRPAEYVETQTAKLMLTAIKQAVRLRTMAAITSDSGRGKTLIAKAANSTFTGVYLRVLESHRGKSRFLLQLARALKLTTGRHLNAPDLHLRIIDQLEGSGRPIIIDEAHRLQIDALEVVRDIHDDCGCPVVLFGTRDLDRQVDDRDRFFGQLSRRITVRLDLNDWARDGGDEPV